MLSTKRNIAVTFLLLAILGLPSSPVDARITAYASDNESRNFDGWLPHTDWNALPYPPKGGLKGFLIDARTENTCEPVAPPPSSSSCYIALIEHDLRPSRHTGCDFVARVLDAQRAGYKAAVVVHDWNEAFIKPAYIDWNGTLSTPDYIDIGYKRSTVEWIQIHIPSVVVNKETGNSLKLNYTYDKGGRVVLTGPCLVPFRAMSAGIGFGCLGLGSIMIIMGLVWFGLGLGVDRSFILSQIVFVGLTLTLNLIWLAGLTLIPVHLELLTYVMILDVLALIFMLFHTKRACTYFSLVLGFGLTVVGLHGTLPHLRGSMLMARWVLGLVALIMLGFYPFIFAAVSACLGTLLAPRSNDLLQKKLYKKLGGTV